MVEKYVVQFRRGMSGEVNDIFMENKPLLKNGKKYNATIQSEKSSTDIIIKKEDIKNAPGGYRIESIGNPKINELFSKVKSGDFGYLVVEMKSE